MYRYEDLVSMPFRAFGDSDEGVAARPHGHTAVSMPFRAFGDSDSRSRAQGAGGSSAFQCPFGHSGILTCVTVVSARICARVSMPFRAFGDSDRL